MTPQEETIKKIATRIAENMDGRTVTSHEHYRDMLAKEIEFELSKVIEQVEKWAEEKQENFVLIAGMIDRKYTDGAERVLSDLLTFLKELKK